MRLGGDGTTVNTPEAPDAVTTEVVPGTAADGGRLDLVLPPASWHLVRLRVPDAVAGDPS